MKLHLVGEDLASGQGIGRNSAVGRTVVVNNGSELKGRDLDQAVIVTPSIDESIIPYLDQVVALVTEEAGLTSSSAIIGLEKGIPTVVGVNNVVDTIPDNALVTVDATQGRVYEGYANVL